MERYIRNFSELNIYSKMFITLIFLCAFIFWSPVFLTFSHLNVNHFLFLQLAFLLFAIANNRRIEATYIIVALVLLFGAVASAFYWGDSVKIIFYPSIFLFSLLFIALLNRQETEALIDMATLFVIVLLVGGGIGFLYALSGGSYLISITDSANREIFYYLTTFTGSVKSVFGLKIIRVSGIYDEPGALSFIICIVAMLRHIFKKDKKITWLILLGGFLTFSLAHFVYVIFHFLAEKIPLKKYLKYVLPALAVGFIIIASNMGVIFDALILNRLEVSKSGRLKGDNRTEQLKDNYKLLANEDPTVLIWGLDSKCVLDIRECKKQFLNLGSSNPLTPIMRSGILLSWPYYLILIISLFLTFRKRKNWIYFGLFLLLLQRPFVMSFGYSFLILLPIINFNRN